MLRLSATDLVRGAAIALLLAGTATACTPPEAQRVRGGGAGADPGNRTPVIQMHRGARVYHDTPCELATDTCTATLPERWR